VASSERRASQELTLCTNKVALNLDGQNAAQPGPYLVDAMNPCWIWPQADLSRFGQLRVAVTRLPFNFQIGADAAKIVLHPPSTPAGELEVARRRLRRRADRAALAGAGAAQRRRSRCSRANCRRWPGAHDLCLGFTAPQA